MLWMWLVVVFVVVLAAAISTLNQTLAIPYSEIRIIRSRIRFGGIAHLAHAGWQRQRQLRRGGAGDKHRWLRVAALHFEFVLFQHGGLSEYTFD